MKYRLLIAIEVLDFSQSLSKREQTALWKRFREMADGSHRFADYSETDSTQRDLNVHVHAGFAIFFWEDAADRHVKILHLRRADG